MCLNHEFFLDSVTFRFYFVQRWLRGTELGLELGSEEEDTSEADAEVHVARLQAFVMSGSLKALNVASSQPTL